MALRHMRSQQVDILCTHPMFGPDSGKASWQGLNFMYERVRVASSPTRQQRAANLLKVCTLLNLLLMVGLAGFLNTGGPASLFCTCLLHIAAGACSICMPIGPRV